MLMHHRCISILSVKFFCDFCEVFILLWFGFILFVCLFFCRKRTIQASEQRFSGYSRFANSIND